MARKSTSRSTETKIEKLDPPKTLKDHPFFGLKLDAEQEAFRDAIWSDEYDVVFTNSKAGTGKTTLAVATAMLLVEYGKYSGIYYMTEAGVHEFKQGLLPGSLEEKSAPLFAPLYQAVARLGYDPQRVVVNDFNMAAQKNGTAMINALTDSYVRGISIGEWDSPVVVLIDEAQNMTLPVIRTVLSRVNDGSKVVCIGHTGQIDLKYPQDSGFVRALERYRQEPWCKVCNLTKNYRGRISSVADEL